MNPMSEKADQQRKNDAKEARQADAGVKAQQQQHSQASSKGKMMQASGKARTGLNKSADVQNAAAQSRADEQKRVDQEFADEREADAKAQGKWSSRADQMDHGDYRPTFGRFSSLGAF